MIVATATNLLSIKDDKVEDILSGHFRGITETQFGIYFLQYCDGNRTLLHTPDEKMELDITNPHDLVSNNDILYITGCHDNEETDSVIIYDTGNKEIISHTRYKSMHLSSVLPREDKIYGCVHYLDSTTQDTRTSGAIIDMDTYDVAISGLWQPYSLRNIDDKYYVLDSLQCGLIDWTQGERNVVWSAKKGNNLIGMSFDGDYIYICNSSIKDNVAYKDLGITFNDVSCIYKLDFSYNLIDIIDLPDDKLVYDLVVPSTDIYNNVFDSEE